MQKAKDVLERNRLTEGEDFLFIPMGKGSRTALEIKTLSAENYWIVGDNPVSPRFRQAQANSPVKLPMMSEWSVMWGLNNQLYGQEIDGGVSDNNGTYAAYIKGQGFVLARNPKATEILKKNFNLGNNIPVPMSNGEEFADPKMQQKWVQMKTKEKERSKKFGVAQYTVAKKSVMDALKQNKLTEGKDFLLIPMGKSAAATEIEGLGNKYLYAGENADTPTVHNAKVNMERVITEWHIMMGQDGQTQGAQSVNNGTYATYIKGFGFVLSADSRANDVLQKQFKLSNRLSVPMSNGEKFSDPKMQQKWEKMCEVRYAKFLEAEKKRKATKGK